MLEKQNVAGPGGLLTPFAHPTKAEQLRTNPLAKLPALAQFACLTEEPI
jgi:hypothetical protein